MSLDLLFKQLPSSGKKRLAELAGTSVGTLRQWAGNYRKGKLKTESALRVVLAVRVLKAEQPTRDLPEVTLQELSPVCVSCPYCPKQPPANGLDNNVVITR